MQGQVVKCVVVLLGALMLSVVGAVAQEGDVLQQPLGVQVEGKTLRVPNNEDILARTIDSESPYWLPRLLGRYLSGGEGMTDEEYHYLYYGYAYSEAYKPLEPITAEDLVLGAMESVMQEPTEANLKKVVDYGLRVMERDPFSPKNLNFLAYAYGLLGDEVNEKRCFDRLNRVLATIESSGTGVKEGSPMHVLSFSHAADLIYARGQQIKRREVVSRTAEFVFLDMKDRYGNQGYYFDFSRIYWTKPDVLPEREKRGWTLNNVPIN